MSGIVDVSHLTVRYPGVVAVDDVTLLVNEGDFVGIIGPNGAGKSTLFACMLGLNPDYRGSIRFFGQDIRRSRKHLKFIGYVPQKPVFEPGFPATVRDVIMMGLSGAAGINTAKKSADDQIDEILQQMWIHELAHRRIGELSGGQQQRVFIAKALINRPRLLILDEPVTGIDAESTEMFYSILRDINSRQRITILWSSHDMDAVGRLANKVACLDKTLFFHGNPGDFFADESLVRKYSEASMQRHMHDHHHDDDDHHHRT